jgi:hypothetical protein
MVNSERVYGAVTGELPFAIFLARLFRHLVFRFFLHGHAVWLYFRFSLSFRDVEELLAQRGVVVIYETGRNSIRKKLSLLLHVYIILFPYYTNMRLLWNAVYFCNEQAVMIIY